MHDFSWVFWPDHQRLLDYLSIGGEARFVGGAVRNSILGLLPDDFDLATTHTPEMVIKLLETHDVKVIPTGIAHGTVTALIKGVHYEITTLRKDLITDGRWAQVGYTSSWEEDAKRRDFTINALYIDKNGKLYDYVNGLEDAQNGCIRFIGDPVKRIQEDFLRILRFFRLWAYYGKYVDDDSLQAAIDLKSHLIQLSGERITKEFLKLLTADNPWHVVSVLCNENFLTLILGQHQKNQIFQQLEIIEKTMQEKQSPWIRLLSLGLPPFPRLVLSRCQLGLLKDLSVPTAFHKALESIYNSSLDITKGRLILYASKLMQQKNLAIIEQLLSEIQSISSRTYSTFPISGKDLIALDFAGPRVGQILNALKQWWVSHHCVPSRDECLAELSKFQD